MKRAVNLLLTILSFLVFNLSKTAAQGVGVNATGAAPDASAMLDISSATKGFLPPRMTMAQRDLISLPANGLLIYQTTDVTGLYLNEGTSATPNWSLIGPVVSASPAFVFATDQSVSGNSYVGVSSSGVNFLRHTLVVPVACTLRSIVVSTRSNRGVPVTATVMLNTAFGTPIQTTLSATVIGGSITGVGSGAVPVIRGDLISIYITFAGSALPDGVAVSVTYQ